MASERSFAFSPVQNSRERFWETLDVPQQGAQILGDRMGEGLQLFAALRVLRILAAIARARSFAALRMTTAAVMLRRYLGSNEEG